MSPARATTSPGGPTRRARVGVGGPSRSALAPRAVTAFTSTVLSLASTAPAYSLAVTVGLLASLVGAGAPLLLLVSALPVALVVSCFAELNRAEPDCGTCYAWTRRAFGHVVGRMTGWVSVAACVLVMSNLVQVAAIYALTVVGADHLAGSRLAQGALGCALLAAMAYLAHRGITVAARTQVVLFGLELTALVVVVLRAVATAPLPATGEPAPGADVGPGALVAAFLVAVFLYWGWDSSFSVNEESVAPTRTPARAALLALGALAVLYAGFAWAVGSWAGTQRLAAVGEEDLFAVLGAALMGSTGGTLLAGAVLVSALASAQTTILPAARSLVSMARGGAVPIGLARTADGGSPSAATWAFTAVSALVYLGLLATSDAVLADSVAATAILIALYYGLTCAAVPFYFRSALRERPVRRVLLPLVAATLFGAVLVVAALDLSATSVAAVLVVLGLGGATILLRPDTASRSDRPDRPDRPHRPLRRDPR